MLYAQNQDCPEHEFARDDIAICELVLLELYQLLRNPAVLSTPLSAPDAAAVCAAWRNNRRWALIENAPVMDKVWAIARRPDIARRAVFDAGIAMTLGHHGVTEDVYFLRSATLVKQLPDFLEGRSHRSGLGTERGAPAPGSVLPCAGHGIEDTAETAVPGAGGPIPGVPASRRPGGLEGRRAGRAGCRRKQWRGRPPKRRSER